ncbi:VC0807 family protein [Nocardia altamirensis]|uniref:VC0807 family protein n=1 Tax=Nocardia altamirensis TaxID=472158 RepID=UPI000B1AD5CB|nr:VC0807 family protein [Nocardia altamirensis]
MSTTDTSPQAAAADRTPQQKRAALRRHLLMQLILEVVLPLGSYYALRAAGVNPWLALIAPGLLIAGILAYRAIRQRRVDAMALFTLSLIVVGTVMTVLTGDPRTLMVRDSWIFGVLGLWVLATLLTQRPFMRIAARAIVTVKIGEEGYRQWDARWDNDSRFRGHLRLLTAVWGTAFVVDAVIRILLAYTLPIDAIPLVSTVQWLVVLAALIAFQNVYVTRHGLKV